MFEFFTTIFNAILYQPLFNFLILIYNYLPGSDLGLSIIFLTSIIFLILSPVSIKAVKSQKALSELQPKIQDIQKKYKGDKEKQVKATMELYQKAEINPFKGCLPLIFQMPILITLFLLFKNLSQIIKDGGGLGDQVELLYSFVSVPSIINTKFLGLVELTEPSMILAVFAGATQFLQTKMLSPKFKKSDSKTDFSQLMQKQMVYFFPFLTILILWKLSSAIAVYWITTSFLSIFQQFLLKKKHVSNN